MSPMKVLIPRTQPLILNERQIGWRREDDAGFSPELERMVAQKDRALKPHQEETRIEN